MEITVFSGKKSASAKTQRSREEGDKGTPICSPSFPPLPWQTLASPRTLIPLSSSISIAG